MDSQEIHSVLFSINFKNSSVDSQQNLAQITDNSHESFVPPLLSIFHTINIPYQERERERERERDIISLQVHSLH
jgi:hypothetical protein